MISLRHNLAFSIFVLLTSLVVVFGVVVETTYAQANPEINYQGKLTLPSGVAVPDGTYNMRFWLISSSTAATSSAEWTEELTGTDRVQVTNGLFSVMLGSTTALTGVDFNQTLYLGVEIGGTGGSPAWDGEMSPRKVLGMVPAAFVANTAITATAASSADALSGIASSSFLRSDEADTMEASSSNPILSVIQNGAGAIARFFSGVTEVFTILNNGNVGVGTSTPQAKFAVAGNTLVTGSATTTGSLYVGDDIVTAGGISASQEIYTSNSASADLGYYTTGGAGLYWDGGESSILGAPAWGLSFRTNATERLVIDVDGKVGIGSSSPSALFTVAGNSYLGGSLRLTGALLDSTAASGTVGTILQSTGTSTRWVATSTLGLGNGTFLGLTDTPSSFTANRLFFTNGGATAVTDSADLTFNGTSFVIGSSSNTLNVSTAAGAVSINTATQDEELTVSGSAKVSTAYQIGSIGGANALSILYNSISQNYDNTDLSVFSGTTLANRAGVQFQASSSPYTVFTNGGTEVMRLLSSGNVGIGTSSPAARLGVNGIVLADRFIAASTTGTSSLAGKLTIGAGETLPLNIYQTSGPTRVIENQVSGGYLQLAARPGLSDLCIDNNGNIGVGSCSLTKKFTVADSSDAALRLNYGGGTSIWDFSVGAANNNLTLTQTSGGGNAFVIASSSVGIGTSTPAALFGVAGLSLADYFRAASTTATSSFAGNAVFSKAGALFGFGTTTPVSQFTINGNRSNSSDNSSLTTGSETFGVYNNNTRIFAAGITTGGDAMVEVAGANGVLVTNRVLGSGTGDLNLLPGGSSNAVNIRDSNNSSPNAQFLSNGRISFGTTSSSVASLFLQSKASINPFAIASSTGVSLLTLTQAGDLGIGTTSPAAKLGVNGIVLADNFRAASTTAVSSFVGLVGIGTTSSQYPLEVGRNGSTQSGIIHGTLAIGRSAFAVPSTNANIPLKVMGEYSQLSEFGASDTDYDSTIRLMQGFNVNSVWRVLGVSQDVELTTGVGHLALLPATGKNVAIGTSSPWAKLSIQNTFGASTALFDIATTTSAANATSSLFRVLANGNIGVGTSSPASRLGVNGLVLADNFRAASTTATSTFAGGLIVGTNNALRVDGPAGTVSINTTAQDEELTVAGTIKASTALTVGSLGAVNAMTIDGNNINQYYDNAGLNIYSGTSGGNIMNLTLFASSSPYAYFSNGGVETMRITATGAVGIGSSTPSSKLTVAGDSYIGGNLRLTGALLDSTAATGTLGMVLQSTGTSTRWVATSTLGIGSSTWVDNGTYLSTLGIGDGIVVNGSSTIGGGTASTGLTVQGNATTTGDSYVVGDLVVDGTISGYTLYGGYTNSSGITDSVIATNAASFTAGTGAGYNFSVSGTPIGQVASALTGNDNDNSYLVFSNRTSDAVTEKMRITSTGNVGIGSSTPSSKLTVAGDSYIGGNLRLTGALLDSTAATGTLGMVLQSTGTSTRWVATSTLGISGGASTFLSLTDTPSSYTANRVFFTNGAGTAVTDDADLVFDGTNLGIGTTTPTQQLSVAGNALFRNLANSSSAFEVQKANGDYVLSIDTSTTQTFFGGATFAAGGIYGRDGDASSPTFAFTNDSDTGIFGSSGSNYLGFTTGGTERMRLGSTGNLGIGTTTPTHTLSVNGTASVANIIAASTTAVSTIANRLDVGSPLGTVSNPNTLNLVGSLPGITFDSTTLGEAQILYNTAYGLSLETPATRNISFRPNNTTAMTILAGGNVGIGTSTPGAKLTVMNSGSGDAFSVASSSGKNLFRIRDNGFVDISLAGNPVPTFSSLLNVATDASGDVFNWGYNLNSSSDVFGSLGVENGDSTYLRYANSDLKFYRGLSSTETLRLTSGGNVGIGTTTPAAKLGVNGLVLADNFRAASLTSTSTFGPVDVMNSGLVVKQNGYVGIGTNNPDNFNLQVVDQSLNSTYISIANRSTDSDAVVCFGHRSSGGCNYASIGIRGTSSGSPYNTHDQMLTLISATDRIVFGSESTERMRLQNGNLGIGSSTPSSKLTVAGDSYIGGNLRLTGAFLDSTAATGTLGMVLQSTGTSTRWVATSTLGISSSLSGGTNGFLARWTGDSTLSTGLLRDNGTVAGVNATSSSYTFNVQGTSGVNPFNVASSTGTSLFAITNNGRVGIGSTTPSHTLSVNGTVGLANFIAASTTGISTIANRLDIGTTNLSHGNAAIFNIRSLGSDTAIGFKNDSLGEAGIGFNASVYGLTLETHTPGVPVSIRPMGEMAAYFDDAGNVGIGTSTLQSTRLTVDGGMSLSGALLDSTRATGTLGMVLQTTGTSTRWVATSTLGLGISGGTNGFLARWTGDSTLSTGLFRDNGTVAGVNATSSSYTFNVQGTSGVNPFNVSSSTGTSLFTITNNGNVGVGSSTPGARLAVVGLTGSSPLFSVSSTTNASPLLLVNQYGETAIGPNYQGNATLYLDTDENTYASIRNFSGSGDTIFASDGSLRLDIDGDANDTNNTFTVYANDTTNLLTILDSGNVGVGTTSPYARGITIERTGISGTTTAGIGQYLTFANTSVGAQQFGNNTFIKTTNTATTTIVGSILRIEDSTPFGNTVRGFEVQTERGTSTLGENTAISGFARTFGVRGVTEGDAGAVYEPAGVYGETRGTTQGNALRGYSSTITTAALLKLFQDTSTFTGTGLLMNFGNSGGSFSSTTASRFIDLQNAGTSRFTVGAYGMLTIGSGTTNNAGIQIGYGGLCVDNDGSCNASTTGRISSVSTATGNSDLAEMYFSSDDLEAGEVVYLKGGLSVGRASESTKDLVIGVVSTLPGLIMGENDTSLRAGETAHPIALKGRVPVKVSNENGEVKKGDELMLSTVPGVVMKASSTGTVVGIALEDYDEERAYSDTFINQFGESIIVPEYTPINRVSDPRINDGCYFGGGSEAGEAPCVPLTATTTDAQYDEADALALAEAKEEALAELAEAESETAYTASGETVEVGQIVMFVDLRYRYLDADGESLIAALLGEAEGSTEDAPETIWSRLVTLANNFVDGVLSVFTLKADRVETSEICVDGVCVTADDLRTLLEGQGTGVTEPSPEPTPEPEPTPAPDTTTDEVPVPDAVPVDQGTVEEMTEEGAEPVSGEELLEPETVEAVEIASDVIEVVEEEVVLSEPEPVAEPAVEPNP